MYYIFNGSDVSWMSDEEAVEIALEMLSASMLSLVHY